MNVKIECIAWIGLALLVGCADGSGLDALGGSGGSGGAGGAPGGTDGSGGTTSTSAECNSGSDCPDPSDECSLPTCIMNVCGVTAAPVGTPCGEAGGTCSATGDCLVAACGDGVQNGMETGVDCGGGCAPCADGGACTVAADCQSGACVGGVCVACGALAEPCCAANACDAPKITCATNTTTPWGGTAAECNCGILRAGQSLGVDQGRWSCDGRFFLVMQGDGNLVLYLEGTGALWSSMTNGTGAVQAVMQDDGNFVVYDAGGQVEWSSMTGGYPGATLAIQNDGNVVVYDAASVARFATNTCCY
jgi:hypothetical protein